MMDNLNPWSEMDYTPNVPRSDATVWTSEWLLETPATGGRIVAKDARSTIVYAPNCNPYNASEQRLAKLFLYSREMLALLKATAKEVREYRNEYHHTENYLVEQIQDIVAKIEGK